MNKLMIGGVALMMSVATGFAEVIIKDGEKIGFLGDSITAGGAQAPCGYIHLVMDGLKRAGVKDAKAIMAGVSGDNAPKMNKRVESSVLSKNPQWMTLSCGVNDVWWRGEMTIDTYKTNIKEILDKAEKAGTKVIMLAATMVCEKDEKGLHAEQLKYNAFLKEEAAKRKLIFVDLWEAEKAELAKRDDGTPGNKLTRDGIHMNVYGNQMFAKEILRAMGVSEKVIADSVTAWRDLKGAYGVGCNFTMSDFEKLNKKAYEEGFTDGHHKVNHYLQKVIDEKIK